MDLKQLKYLIALVEHGNYARAADSLGITQSALTQSISRLEASVKAKLIERGRFGAHPTDAGKLFLSHARSISAEATLALSELQQSEGAQRPRVSIGVSKTLVYNLAPNAISNVIRKHPEILITSCEGWSPELFRRLLLGELDLVLSSPLPQVSVDFDLKQEALFTQTEVIIIGQNHPLADREHISLADLTDQFWLLPPAGSGRIRFLQSIFYEAGLPPPTRFIRNDSTPLVFSLIRKGQIIAQAVPETVMCYLDPGEYRVIDIPQLTTPRTVYLTMRKRTRLQPAAKIVCDEIRAAANVLSPTSLDRVSDLKSAKMGASILS